MPGWSELVGNLTGPVVLALIIYSGAKKVWQFTWIVEERIALYKQRYDEMKLDRDWWRNAYQELSHTSAEQTDVAKALKDEVTRRTSPN